MAPRRLRSTAHAATECTADTAAAPAAASPAAALTTSVYFANNSAALDADGRRVIADAVRQLQQQPTARAAITGYTDATGNLAANQELAKNRAKAVRDALTGAAASEK